MQKVNLQNSYSQKCAINIKGKIEPESLSKLRKEFKETYLYFGFYGFFLYAMVEIYRKGVLWKQKAVRLFRLVSSWFHFNKRRKDKEKIKTLLSMGKKMYYVYCIKRKRTGIIEKYDCGDHRVHLPYFSDSVDSQPSIISFQLHVPPEPVFGKGTQESIPAWRTGMTTLFVVPARQAT
jgi:hypothetical protein